jgi:hypothetical protein
MDICMYLLHPNRLRYLCTIDTGGSRYRKDFRYRLVPLWTRLAAGIGSFRILASAGNERPVGQSITEISRCSKLRRPFALHMH